MNSKVFICALLCSFSLVGQVTVFNGGTGSQTSVIPSIMDFHAVCDGSHMVADTAAFVAALASGNTGKSIHVPSGTCQIDNSAGPLSITAWSGLIYGDGKGSKIVFNTLSNHGFSFVGVTNIEMRDLDISYSPTVTTRNTSNLIQIVGSSNVALTNLWLHNGNSVALDLTNDSNITADGITMSTFLANGILAANVADAHFAKISCTGVQDSCWEVSYYDSNSPNVCDRITLDGLSSEGDYSGININSCKHVSVSNFIIDSPKQAGLYIRQDSSTTTLVWPDDISISNGTITNTGINTGSDRAGIMLLQGTTGTNKAHVNISNVVVSNTPDWGLLLRDFNNFDLHLSNSMFDAVGTSTSNGTAGGLQFGSAGTHGGDQVHLSNVTVKNAGYWSLSILDTPFFTAEHFNSTNPNQAAAAAIGILNSSTGVINLDTVNLYDSGGTNRSTINDAAASGSHSITNVNSYAAGTWAGITSSNAAIVTSCNVTASGCKSTASANNVFTGTNDYTTATWLKLPGGSGVPSTGCSAVGDVNKVYVRNDAGAPNTSLYICDKSGASTYSWELIP